MAENERETFPVQTQLRRAECLADAGPLLVGDKDEGVTSLHKCCLSLGAVHTLQGEKMTGSGTTRAQFRPPMGAMHARELS